MIDESPEPGIAHSAPTDREEPPKRRGVSPTFAAFLTFLAPGVGHLAAGASRRALFWFVLIIGAAIVAVRVLFGSFAGMVVAFAALPVMYVWAIVDAVRTARRRRGEARPWYGRWFVAIPLAVVLSLATRPLILAAPVYKTFRIPTTAMEPAIVRGDHLTARVLGAERWQPARGDLVVFESAKDAGVLQISRVIGLPGERIAVREKRVWIDGAPLDDPWARHSDPRDLSRRATASDPLRVRDAMAEVEIPEYAVFLLGDNRDESYDSRFTGPLPLRKIRALPLYVYWSERRERIGVRLR